MSHRIYVQESVAEKSNGAFVNIVKGAKKGHPLAPEMEQGPQADGLQHERIEPFLEAAKEGKGKLKTGGEAAQVDGKSFFAKPTVYSGVDEDEKIQEEEIHGPFFSVNAFNAFKTEAGALEKAKATEYGPYASVYTKDISRSLRVAKAFESGTVGFNRTRPTMVLNMPCGGYEGSGQGREGLTYSLEEHSEIETVPAEVDDGTEVALTKAPKA